MIDYYTPPSEEVFQQIKEAAISIWLTYDDTYGYATEKIGSIKDLENIRDNYAYMVAMFDYLNQERLLEKLTGEAKTLVEELTRENREIGKRLADNGIFL